MPDLLVELDPQLQRALDDIGEIRRHTAKVASRLTGIVGLLWIWFLVMMVT